MQAVYRVVCGTMLVGCRTNPHDAIRLAVAQAEHDWRDLTIWVGQELVAIVKTGGDVIPLVEPVWSIA